MGTIADTVADAVFQQASFIHNVTHRRNSPGEYNEHREYVEPGEPAETEVTAIPVPRDGTEREIGNDAIREDDTQRFFIRIETPAVIPDMSIGDEIDWRGVTFRVVHATDWQGYFDVLTQRQGAP